ncbi:MAG: NAD-dependent epimerase/dehydratase family protein [Myxococcales bacterium]|nr:NAD-dependent epimerase/dehydratase family protein [Myxococcales bacterium]
MKVLVTGATGFLGSHLAELLHREGHAVRALVRASSNTKHLESLGAELALASLETGEGLDRAVTGVDAVVHGAGIVKALAPEHFHDVNAGGTARLVDAVRVHNPGVKRFVYVSSLTAHGFSDDGNPRHPEAEARPVTHYGRSKLEGELATLAAMHDFPVTIVRPPAIYGPRDVEMYAFFQSVKRRMMRFMGKSSNILSIVDAPDCAEAILRALTVEHRSGRVYFVEDGRVYTQAELWQHIADALGVRALKVPVPIAAVSAAAALSETYGRLRGTPVMLTRDKVNELRQPYLHCASDEIRKELGWAPRVQFPEGARTTVEWYREHGWL